MKGNLSLFSNFGVTRLCGLWLYYWYWPSQGSGYYQSASSPLLLTISQSLHSGEWGLFCHNLLFQLFNHHRHRPTSISMTVIQSLNEPSELFVSIIKIIIMDSRSYLSLWGVRRVRVRVRVLFKYYKDHHHGHAVLFVLMGREKSQYESWVVWPPGRPSRNCRFFIRVEISRCWLITISIIMIIIVCHLNKYWDDDHEDCDYRWMVGWNPSVISFH